MRRAVLAALFALALASALTNAHPAPCQALSRPTVSQATGGVDRIYVIALRDSQLFTLCPVFGKHLVDWNKVRRGATRGIRGKFVINLLPGSMHVMRGRTVGSFNADLPLPAGAHDSNTSQTLENAREDAEVKAQVRQRLQSQTDSVIVDSPESADFVLVLQSYYVQPCFRVHDVRAQLVPAPARPRDDAASIFNDAGDSLRYLQSQRRGIRIDRGRDEPPPVAEPRKQIATSVRGTPCGKGDMNWRDALVAFAVPAPAFRKNKEDVAALLTFRTWEGFSLSWATTATPNSPQTAFTASVAEVVADYAAARRAPGYLPVCMASSRIMKPVNYGIGR